MYVYDVRADQFVLDSQSEAHNGNDDFLPLSAILKGM